MPSVCVDASLVIILLLPDERREFVRVLWAEWQEQGTTPLKSRLTIGGTYGYKEM
jgi:hypothetical protein